MLVAAKGSGCGSNVRGAKWVTHSTVESARLGCRGFSTQIEVDIGITLEGRSEDELPEKMIGAARMSYTSMDIGDNIDESDGE